MPGAAFRRLLSSPWCETDRRLSRRQPLANIRPWFSETVAVTSGAPGRGSPTVDSTSATRAELNEMISVSRKAAATSRSRLWFTLSTSTALRANSIPLLSASPTLARPLVSLARRVVACSSLNS
ncbi:hypothetical protein D3C87_1468890 [compost metagenome]